MIDLWWKEAEKHGVLPLDDRGAFMLFAASRRPGMPTSRSHFVYYPPMSHIVSDACPPVARGWRMAAHVDHPAKGGDGALVARGSLNSGFVLYIKDGRPHFDYNAFHEHTNIAGAAKLSPGAHTVEVAVTRRPDGGGDMQLLVDGKEVGAASVKTLLFMISSIGMDVGRSYAPVCNDYREPFVYPGKIHKLTFDIPDLSALRGEKISTVRAAEAQQ
jgi:arylsulfatase